MLPSHVVVIVLGDVGRSPRMQYHAHSIAQLPTEVQRVSLVGYSGERCMAQVSEESTGGRLKLNRFALPTFDFLRRIAILHALVRGLSMMISLIAIFISLPSYQVVLIQNPPCLPAAFVAILFSWLNGSQVVLDWHNLGFKMFEERHGEGHLLVRVARYMEKFVAKRAQAHICVSCSLQMWLQEHFQVRPTVLYDKPASIFKRSGTDIDRRHSLFLKLGFTDRNVFPSLASELSESSGDEDDSRSQSSRTIQTEIVDGAVRFRVDAAPLLISATSWTPDENFEDLLAALVAVDRALQIEFSLNKLSRLQHSSNTETEEGVLGNDEREGKVGSGWPCRLAVVVTGKGPLKAAFEARVRALEELGKLLMVSVRTVWLEPEDYPLLMGCASLGVSLHTSTSGLDLPMKVLDMFGSGVPVCAAHFSAISELVQENVNGLTFKSFDELTQQILGLLFPHLSALTTTTTAAATPSYHTTSSDGSILPGLSVDLARLQRGAQTTSSWEDNWTEHMLPLLRQSLAAGHTRGATWRSAWYGVSIIVCVAIGMIAHNLLFHGPLAVKKP